MAPLDIDDLAATVQQVRDHILEEEARFDALERVVRHVAVQVAAMAAVGYAAIFVLLGVAALLLMKG